MARGGIGNDTCAEAGCGVGGAVFGRLEDVGNGVNERSRGVVAAVADLLRKTGEFGAGVGFEVSG